VVVGWKKIFLFSYRHTALVPPLILTNMSLFFNFKVFGPMLFWHTRAAVMNSAHMCFLSCSVGKKTVEVMKNDYPYVI
jgi:hypothetical protein